MNLKNIIIILVLVYAISSFFGVGTGDNFAICDTLGDDWGPNCIHPDDNHAIRSARGAGVSGN